jgi:tellurite resistance protein TerC
MLAKEKTDPQSRFKHALYGSLFWIGSAFLFNGWIYLSLGEAKALEFLSGYLVEKSLSVDNIFVFILTFQAFRISPSQQQRLLLWGMAGALLLRGVMIYGGIALIQKFHWLTYGLGAFLLFTGLHLFFAKKNSQDQPLVLRWSQSFFKGASSRSLYLGALVTIEVADAIFALDSIPAIFAITLDPFIIYTSNIFAILGLRSLYILLSPLLEKLPYLEKGISAILGFVGLKMILEPFYPLSPGITLSVIGSVLSFTLLASLFPRENS